MARTRIGSAIVCTNPWGRLKVGSRYVWLDFHEWCGPCFYTNRAMTKVYDPVDEQDPVWEPFGRWLDKFNAAKAKKQAGLMPNVRAKLPTMAGQLGRGLGIMEAIVTRASIERLKLAATRGVKLNKQLGRADNIRFFEGYLKALSDVEGLHLTSLQKIDGNQAVQPLGSVRARG